MYPELITHCCFDKQLDELWHMFYQGISHRKEIMTKDIPVEPEVTLSKIINWLVWESPNAKIELYVNDFTEQLAETLDAIYARKTTPVGMTSAPLVASVSIDLPLLIDENVRNIIDAFVSRHDTATYTISQGHGIDDNEQLSITSARGQFRCGIPIRNIIEGQLDQAIGTKIRKLSFTSIRTSQKSAVQPSLDSSSEQPLSEQPSLAIPQSEQPSLAVTQSEQPYLDVPLKPKPRRKKSKQ